MRGEEGEEVRGGSEDCVGIVREGEGRAIGRNGYSTVRMKGCRLGGLGTCRRMGLPPRPQLE